MRCAPSQPLRASLFALTLPALTLPALTLLAAGCAEEPPPPPPPTSAPAPAPTPAAPPPSPCDVLCDRVMACDMSELGDRNTCVRRCMARAPRDTQMLDCLAAPTPDGARRCDLARRCAEVWVERGARPAAISPERERLDARALGPEVEISLEARLLNASPDASRYDLVLLLRGRGQWDGGVGEADAGEPLDAGPFDAGSAAPDLWVRVGGFSSDGRLPLVRVAPPTQIDLSSAEAGEVPLLQHGAFWAGSGDTHRVRRVRDELVVEHAFLQSDAARAQLEADFAPRLRIQLAPGARVTARRTIVE